VASYAWSLEALLQVSTPGLGAWSQLGWGAILGAASVTMLGARPADGAFMGIGIALLFGDALVRRRIGWRGLAAASAIFVLLGAVVLPSTISPWSGMRFQTPAPGVWRYALPLSTGAYCWWPCSMPLGVVGLAMLRGRARGLVLAFLSSLVPYVVFLACLQPGHGQGEYGPKCLSLLVVPLAVGGGVAIAPMAAAAMDRRSSGASALSRGGPIALVVFALVSAWLRIVPLEWPVFAEQVRKHFAAALAPQAREVEALPPNTSRATSRTAISAA
jgi:hypothetical protein